MTFLLLLLSPSLFSFLSLPHGYVHTHTRIDELKKGGSLVYGADEDDEEKGPGRNVKHHTQVLLVDTAASSFDIVYFLLSFSHSSLSPFPLNCPFFLSLSLSLNLPPFPSLPGDNWVPRKRDPDLSEAGVRGQDVLALLVSIYGK
jgi:hypothetical protein